ncbi:MULTISPECIES: ABC transporter ATP-binding protein [Thermoactinomyces]|jgi:ABC-2 type transport system ATP-binding protein|uniref:ABC transporter ATP-binding protein n=1 Tax=Thermoactinomyces daqus TaxID=1329516 RepID=A0A7W1X788_9BACL|nr:MULTISPECIES: ABC transporter ATP-binding protein [Thermoactinomyces]MBA4541371.1 ABC transporter ATP-binding protein [Thermoactinomyces daqus]MBH8596844.1 ABC transporter ATP-binding protein [Thermoactinomyces sp. CICC 10523]MBH8603604.1 ABC transporter ATP-binding protein [Thermoactinomyces sp. CICC 10522]MBH8606769.1 ABC transporter ATP-binding protein [Thermoactinomyces sp. CICC 10521]
MAKQNKPVLYVEGLSKTIRRRTIVQDISFEVGEGEIFGFLGPNGAGKTTTIRMLVGLIRPSKGKVKIGGYDLQTDFLKAISHVGCIVENPELYPYLTGRENLELFARMARIDHARIREVVEQVELTERIDDPVKTYSLGMRQRLGIAQALLGKPKLLILDEPTNGLDPAGIRELRAFIRKLARKDGISVFVSSHILHEVQLMCDRVAIIHQGKLVQTGPIGELVGDQSMVEWKIEPADRGLKVLQSLPYVTRWEQPDDGRILVHMPAEKIAETNRSLVDKQILVHEIRTHRPTLEDIFLQMTGGVESAASDL